MNNNRDIATGVSARLANKLFKQTRAFAHAISDFPIKHLYLIGVCCSALFILFALAPPEQAEAKRNNLNLIDKLTQVEADSSTIEAPNFNDPSALGISPEAEIYDLENPLPKSWRRIRVEIRAGDTLGKVFERLSINAANTQIIEQLTSAPQGAVFSLIHPGETLTFDFDAHDTLQGLSLRATPLIYYIASRTTDNRFKIEEHHIKPDVHTSIAHATIQSSLFKAGQQADLSETLVMELAKIFRWDIDFAQDIHEGDQFSVVYETHYLRGKAIGSGKILAAEFINDGRTFSAIRFEDANGEADYYSVDGEPMHKAFLRTPVEFTHISSYFDPHREHPILHSIRAHKGVDYAAPRGTPVKAAGDGEIVFAGTKSGYGNVIMIQHGAQYRTVYAHLNGYAKNIKANMPIHQGQIIGYVGSTGLATGPHLHYEFQVNGIHQNPLTVKLPNSPSLSPKYLAAFKTQSQFLIHQLALAKTNQTIVASSQ